MQVSSLAGRSEVNLQKKRLKNVQSIAVGTSNADPCAVIDATSNSKGVLVPRLTTEQINSIPFPVVGLILYNRTTNTLNVFDGQWKSVQIENPDSQIEIIQNAIRSINNKDLVLSTLGENNRVMVNKDLVLQGGNLLTPAQTMLTIQGGNGVTISSGNGQSNVDMDSNLNMKSNDLTNVGHLKAEQLTVVSNIECAAITGAIGPGPQQNISGLGPQAQNLDMGGQSIVSVNNVSAATIDGVLSTGAQPNVSRIGVQAADLNMGTYDITNAGAIVAETLQGNLVTQVQSNVTTMPQLASINNKSVPDSDFVGISDTQTLTNKTIDGSQIIDQSLALGKMTSVPALSLIGNSSSSSAVPDSVSMTTLKTMGNFLDTSWTGSSNVNTLASTVNGLTFPSSNFVGVSDAQTLTNKTIDGSQIANQTLPYNKLATGTGPVVIGIVSGTGTPSALTMAKLKTMGSFLDTTWTGSSNVSTLASTVNGLTFPSSNFVGISDAQTLTNKTINGSQIVNQSLNLGKVVPVAALSLIGNSSSSSAVPEALTTAQVKTLLNISDQQSITLNGDVTGSGTGSVSTAIASGSVSLGKMATLAANSIIGNNTGVTATPIALTTVQAKTLLALDNVENTALSTWTGSTSITSIGSLTALNTDSITSPGNLAITPNFGAGNVQIWSPLDMKTNSISNVGALNALTLPSSNFVGINDVQTLTNKTIDGSQIVSSSIATAKLADGCVTAAKIATGVIPSFPASYMFRRKDATQTIGSSLSGVYVVVSFPTAVVSNNITYTSTGSDFYATVAEAGRYIVQWALTWNYAATQTRIETYVQYSSATSNTRHGFMSYGSGSSSDHAMASSAVLNLVANDAVRVWFMHNHSGNLTNNPSIVEWGYLNIVRIQ